MATIAFIQIFAKILLCFQGRSSCVIMCLLKSGQNKDDHKDPCLLVSLTASNHVGFMKRHCRGRRRRRIRRGRGGGAPQEGVFTSGRC